MAKDQTTLSIDKVTKKKAEQMAKKMHLSLSGVARILLNDFADGKIQIATVMVVKDKELDEALRDVAQGKNIEGPFNSAEEFTASLKR
ncbi:hypothetical protein COV82_05985 [Candidatus Peregrinibacteria bacterium CG11_big_fil_rev_8_21_14_0_20_46_8]|nr:MAG: hypothetical protein COV82_05985 [Candidatus Peregrinibacteria bacterium CG11_big_fil_rev_8_21_14_0_20_46_8]